MRIHFEAKSLYRMMNAALLTYLAMFVVGSYFGIAKVEAVHILAALTAVVLLALFQFLSAKGRILLGLGIFGCLGAMMAVVGLRDSVGFVLSYVNWMFGGTLSGGATPGKVNAEASVNSPIFGQLWQEEWLIGYEILQVILLVLICYIFQIVLEKEFRIKLLSALLLVAGLVYCFFTKEELPSAGVTLTTGYLLMVFTEWTQLHWKKKKSRSIQTYMLWMMPFIMGYMIVLLCMPVPQKPYDWKIVKDTYAKISASFHTISMNVFSFGREDFDQSLSGFSEKGRLGGDISDSEREIMTIQSDGGLKTNIYLIGRVYDTFDGSQWQQENEDDTLSRFLDTVQTMYAIRRFDKDFQQDYMYRADLKIRYEDFRTKYLFAPLKIYSLEQMDRPISFEKSGDNFLFAKKKGYGTEYDVIYYQLNMGQKTFAELLEAQVEINGAGVQTQVKAGGAGVQTQVKAGEAGVQTQVKAGEAGVQTQAKADGEGLQIKSQEDENILQEVLMSLSSRMDVELTQDDLERQTERIYATYLSDVALSTEVADYLEQITQNAGTDVEKLYAIEAALAGDNNFVYTKSPGKLPDSVTDGSSFLDYFLLESKQGYCSYFATAFCLLARAEGIPARYVQGYCVPMGEKEEVTVTSDMVHAWPEVYMDGIGWIPFEPTPGYGELRYTPWAMKKGETVTKTDSSGYYAKDWATEEEETEEIPSDLLIAETTTEAVNSIDFGKVLWVLLSTLTLILVVAVFMIFLERLIGRYRYNKMDENGKYLVEVGKNLKILAWLLVERKEDETLEELHKRAALVLVQDTESLNFLIQYEEILYGNRQVSGDMLDLTKKEQEQLLQILKEKKRWTYWYYRIWQ